ncbi:monoacylglycerol lipase ABHD6-like, partial [Olea europaea subsp. europaea]
ELGDNATIEGIEKAGHLVHLERPRVYNRCLNKFLASFHAHANQAKYEV